MPRFLFASSCSLYGAAGDEMLDETADVQSDHGVRHLEGPRRSRTSPKLADDSFSPTYLRNATAYGVSPRLRADIVVNNLVGVAYTTGEVLIQSDGTPWRPLVHVQDISRAFLAVLEAPREAIHNQAFNVGSSQENYQIRDVADDGAGGRAGLLGQVPGRRRPRSALLSRQLRQADRPHSRLPHRVDRPARRRGAVRELSAPRSDRGAVRGLRAPQATSRQLLARRSARCRAAVATRPVAV